MDLINPPDEDVVSSFNVSGPASVIVLCGSGALSRRGDLNRCCARKVAGGDYSIESLRCFVQVTFSHCCIQMKMACRIELSHWRMSFVAEVRLAEKSFRQPRQRSQRDCEAPKPLGNGVTAI